MHTLRNQMKRRVNGPISQTSMDLIFHIIMPVSQASYLREKIRNSLRQIGVHPLTVMAGSPGSQKIFATVEFDADLRSVELTKQAIKKIFTGAAGISSIEIELDRRRNPDNDSSVRSPVVRVKYHGEMFGRKIYNLLDSVPSYSDGPDGHPVGSTVSDTTLNQSGVRWKVVDDVRKENPNKPIKSKSNSHSAYGASYSLQELADHYEALIGSSNGLSRKELLAGLRGTEFDEHAYGNYPSIN